MATDRERMKSDAKAHGFDPDAVDDTGGVGDRDQLAYIALKLFQIEGHMRRIADAAVIGSDSEGVG